MKLLLASDFAVGEPLHLTLLDPSQPLIRCTCGLYLNWAQAVSRITSMLKQQLCWADALRSFFLRVTSSQECMQAGLMSHAGVSSWTVPACSCLSASTFAWSRWLLVAFWRCALD